MVHRAAAIGEEGIGNSSAFIDGHGGQIDAIGDITNGIDVRNVGALMGINSNAMPVVGNARLLQCQRFQKGFAAGGLQHHISFQSGVSAAQHHAAVGLLDGCGLQAKAQGDAELVHTVKKDERVALLRQELSKLTFPAKFQLALDPRFECSGLKVEKCKCMDSKKVPLWLVFKNADPLGDSLVVIFKAGDDLRQDALTLQIIRIMERKWEREGLDLKLSPYGCVSTGDETGFIEVVLNSNTTANITKKYSGGAGGAFSKEPMKLWLQEHNPGERDVRRSFYEMDKKIGENT